MKILVDGDSCPVLGITAEIAAKYALPLLIFCDTAHQRRKMYGEWITVDKGRDEADFALAARISPGDAVITGDYGLAAMAMAKGAAVLNDKGRFYREEEIDSMLAFRHLGQKLRRSGGRLKGPPKRSREDDGSFCRALEELCKKAVVKGAEA